MLSVVAQLSQRLGIQPSQEQTNNVVRLVNREGERSLSSVLTRRRDRKLSPMSKSFRKTLRVNIILIKILSFICLTLLTDIIRYFK